MGRIKLLIADDEIAIRKGLEDLDWESIGISVCYVASDGSEALAAIESMHPDIILTDISMPGLNGISLARYAYEKNLDCQIVFLSGYDDFAYARSAITYGVFEYILKPSDPREILVTIRNAAEALRVSRTLHTSMTSLQGELNVRKIVDMNEQISDPDAAVSKTDKTVRFILSYIEENYMKDISLVTLSNETHFNVIYICRILKKKTGHTFLEILLAVRMIRAAKRLSATDDGIALIASQVGIKDQKYFSQVFKKVFGITPTEYRRSRSTGSVALNVTDILSHIGAAE